MSASLLVRTMDVKGSSSINLSSLQKAANAVASVAVQLIRWEGSNHQAFVADLALMTAQCEEGSEANLRKNPQISNSQITFFAKYALVVFCVFFGKSIWVDILITTNIIPTSSDVLSASCMPATLA